MHSEDEQTTPGCDERTTHSGEKCAVRSDLLPDEGLILCAVSGGVDSMYLLSTLFESGHAVAAAHFNHGLRGAEADRDEAFVRDFCAGRGIAFHAGRGDTRAYAAQNRLGVEEAARTLRYAFLERTADASGAAVIATAHTADDNAETLLMHLMRGAGLRGLGGIPPVRGRVVRPMLDVTHAEAAAYLAAHGIGHVEDSTNALDDCARNRIRHGVIPALCRENPGFLRAAGRMAALAREDEAVLDGLARDFLREHAVGRGVCASALTALPAPIARRAVRLLADAGTGAASALSYAHTEDILRVAREGGTADVTGLRAVRWGDRLVLGAEEAAALAACVLTVGEPLALPEAGAVVLSERIDVCPADVHRLFNTFYFKCENICGNIIVGARQPGDTLRPAGRGCTKTLKALLREAGVPPWERGSVPVLRDDDGVIAVGGVGAAERVCARPGDRDILRIEIRRESPAGEGHTK